MANFKVAYELTAINEGGYANDPDDRGGETWCGIARKMHPDWSGWSIIDLLKHEPNFPANLRSKGQLSDLKLQFYESNFWNPIRGGEISFQEIANQIYDDAVNGGVPGAIAKAQNVAFGLPEDEQDRKLRIKELGIAIGKMDDKTLNKINLAA